MYATERRRLISEALGREGRVAVTDLAERFAVTTETVRRDLAALELAGGLRRVHGGAVPSASSSVAEAAMSEKRARNSAAKQSIARAAQRLLPSGFSGSIYLDAGSTTAALAELLPARIDAQRTEIVTHAAAIAARLSELGAEVYAIGGRVRGLTGAAVGARTVAAIDALRPDVAFIGTNAIAADSQLSTPDPDEADVKRAVVSAARRIVLLVDRSKYGAESLQHFARFDEVDVTIVDAAPEGELATRLAEAGVEVIVA